MENEALEVSPLCAIMCEDFATHIRREETKEITTNEGTKPNNSGWRALEHRMSAVEMEYVRTNTGDLVSRRAKVHGSQNLYLKGKSIIMPDAIIRGELQAIRIGRYCVIGEGTVIRPAYRVEPDGSHLKCRFTPLSVGNHTFIGKGCVVESAGIGCNVRIDDGCVLGRNSFVRDNCHLLAGTVLPEGAVVPPFTVLGGAPARVVSVLHESTASMWTEDAITFYENFEPTASSTA